MGSLWKGTAVATTVVSGIFAWKWNTDKRVHMEARKDIDVTYQEFGGGLTKASNDAFKFGVPVRSRNVSTYKNHALCYNNEKKIPHWVLELLSKDTVKGAADRGKSNFTTDPNVTQMFASRNEDYSKSGWSRGHMAAAGNHKHDQDAMNETFFLSNIVPQDIDNNSGFWNMVEIYCRDLVNKFDKVWVITGPLFLPRVEGDKKFIKYEVVGKNEVAVPSHLFKVVLAEDGKKQLVGAFVVPNTPIPRNRTLKEHQVPIEYVERKSGFEFFPNMIRQSAGDLCKVEGCNLRSRDEYDKHIIGKKIEGAKTANRLEKAWKELSEKGLQPDRQTIEEYNRKKRELESGGIKEPSFSRSRG